MNVKTRMAPSPTGEYHIGHIRTLLYNYAFAKKHNGKFVIRIEDTDRARFVKGSPDRILDVITDYGFSWDEGPRVGGKYGPYVQSERLEMYKKYAMELVAKGYAYYCFCTKERLDEMRASQRKKKLPVTKYDGHCRSLSQDDVKEKLESGCPCVIRLNISAFKMEKISFTDEIYGDVEVEADTLDDQVLLKSDGYPTYHLGVVVDDHLMEITHIMRGIDWLPSTPKHVLLYKAFGWELPVYIHLPNLKELGQNKKLSKRFGPVSAVQFLEEGYLPEAVVNFLMFLGWNPGTEKEIYTLDEFINDFSIDRVHKTDLVAFDRDKLLWFNGVYIREMESEELYSRVINWAERFKPNSDLASLDKEKVVSVLGLVRERMKKLNEFLALSGYFFEKPSIDLKLLRKFAKKDSQVKDVLDSFISVYNNVSEWTSVYLDTLSHEVLKEKGYKPKEAFMTLRVALSGTDATPPLFEIMYVLGKEEVLQRLQESRKALD